MTAAQRLLKYVRVGTMSEEESETTPSSSCQWDLARLLEEEMRQNPQILLTITRVLARTVRMLSDHVDTMAFLRADQRIARYLLSVPEDEEHVIHCTQEEIAAAVSVSRVTASRVLNRFVRCGLLQTGYGSLRILDASGLEQCARQGFEA